VRDLEVPLGDCPAAFVTRHLLDPARLRETWYKWFLVREVERLGRLPELVLPGVDIKDVDKVLTDYWNDEFHLSFTEKWGGHACGTKGGCELGAVAPANARSGSRRASVALRVAHPPDCGSHRLWHRAGQDVYHRWQYEEQAQRVRVRWFC
jgi:hypothetical protein